MNYFQYIELKLSGQFRRDRLNRAYPFHTVDSEEPSLEGYFRMFPYLRPQAY